MAKIERGRDDDTNAPPVTFAAFKGLVNTVSPSQLAQDELAVAINVDLTDKGTLRRRKGYIKKVTLPAENLWAEGDTALFSSAGSLYKLNSDYTYSALAAGLATARMSYVSVNGVIYHSNGVQMGAYQNGVVRTWGLKHSTVQPSAVALINGLLPAGTYQYVVTFERNDGQESGAGLAGSVSLPGNSGIYFYGIPVSADPTVDKVRIYLSPTNGDMLYYAVSVPNGTTTYSYLNAGADLGVPLRTQFKTRPPVGTDLALYNGSIYIAVGNFLHRTLPYNYELSDFREYMDFGAPVKLVAVVDDGIFVATDAETLFLSGAGYPDFTVDVVAPYGAIPGTLTYADGALFGASGQQGVVPVWESDGRGKCVGRTGGSLDNLTQDNYIYSSAEVGASILMRSNGVNQHISVLQG